MSGTTRYTIRPYDTIWMLAQIFNTTVDSIMQLNPGINPRNLQIGQVVTIAPGHRYYESYPEQSFEEGIENEVGVGEEAGVNGLDDGVEADEMDMDLTCYMHRLWEQHVTWTRIAVMAILHDLPETDLILQRLLRNPVDFAEALAPFYGEEAAQQFAQLFTAHLTIAAELVRAAKANDPSFAEIEQRWYDNADQIAAFLASINPYWSEDDWSAMLDEHLGLLGKNVADMAAQNYEASIEGYDDIEAQALEMADMMAEGILMQFPG